MKPVVFIDSGVGGLPYYGYFKKIAPWQAAAYVADKAHFPYGPKSKTELSQIVVALVQTIVDTLDPAMIVIACNSASVSALETVRAQFLHLPVVGTVPAIKPAALNSKKKRVGILATERTVNDPYTAWLSQTVAPDCEIFGVAAPELVTFVEKQFLNASAGEIKTTVRSYLDRFKQLDVDVLVLGCTHFLFLAEEFTADGGADIAIFDSRAGVANRAVALLKEQGLFTETSPLSSPPDAFYITGSAQAGEQWQQFAAYYNLDFKGTLGESL